MLYLPDRKIGLFMDERGCSAHLPRIRAEREKEKKKGERGERRIQKRRKEERGRSRF